MAPRNVFPVWPRGLAGYMALAFSLLSTLLTVVIVGVVQREATEHVQDTIGRGLGELAVQTVDKLDRGMYERYRDIALLVHRRELGDPARSLAERRALLDDVLDSYRYYGWIGLAGPDGKVTVAAKGRLEGMDVSMRPWFRDALRGRHVGDVHEAVLLARYYGGGEREPMRFVDVAFPYPGRDGRPAGVVGAHLSWVWARDVQRSIIAPLEAGRKVEAMIVDAGGRVLLGPPGLQDLRLPGAALRVDGRPAGVRQCWSDGRCYLVGVARSHGYADFPGLGWQVLVREDVQTALQPVRRLRRYALASGLALALLFSVAGALVAGWITRPLKRLAHAARDVQDGRATLVAGGTSSYEEVRLLAASLNRLVRSLVWRGQMLERLNATLEGRVRARTVELAAALADVESGARRLRTVIDIAQDAFIGIGMDGAIVDWNPQAATMFGWTREEAIGRPIEAIVPARFAGSVGRSLARYHASGELTLLGRRIERVVCDRHGTEFPIEMTLNLVDAGPRPFFSMFVHDISMRKKVEGMKNTFIATASHELRTPLTSMRVALALLDEGTVGALDAESRELIGIAHRHCERLVRLADDMLDIQKIEAGVLALDRVRQPVRPLLDEAVLAMRPLARERGVALACAGAGADGMEPVADVDRDRLLQVLTNLLSNAIKFSPPGSAASVSAAALPDGVRIVVADQGRGIPEAFRARLFQRFAHQGSGGGSGLGLSICKGIVEQHGGRIAVASEEGRGTTFVIDLPAGRDVNP